MSQPFRELHHGQQIALYTEGAQRALQAYDLGSGVAQIELLTCVNNATFKVVVDHLHARPKWFALRVHRPGTTDEASIRSELRWLIALQQETNLQTPRPSATTAGEPLSMITLEHCLEPLYCVLFEWIDGRFLHTSAQDPHMAWQVGQCTAALHAHSQYFSATSGLVRRHLDAANLVDWAVLDRLRNAQIVFTDEHLAIFRAVHEHIRQVFQQIGPSATTFGLIHADLIWKNYFFHTDGVGALDFDSCGWGYYLYDLAPTLLGYRDEPHYLALRDALLAGYRSIRPLSVHHEQFLDTCIAARHLVSCCWLANRLDHSGLRARAGAIVAERTAEMQRLIAVDG